jgi:hypothetical protein
MLMKVSTEVRNRAARSKVAVRARNTGRAASIVAKQYPDRPHRRKFPAISKGFLCRGLRRCGRADRARSAREVSGVRQVVVPGSGLRPRYEGKRKGGAEM